MAGPATQDAEGLSSSRTVKLWSSLNELCYNFLKHVSIQQEYNLKVALPIHPHLYTISFWKFCSTVIQN